MSSNSIKEKILSLFGYEYDDSDIEEIKVEAINDKPAEIKPPVLLHEPAKVSPSKETTLLPLKENVRVAIFAPLCIKDCILPTKALKNGSYVILDYNLTTTSEALKCFYFMWGVKYAIEGSCEKISKNIFLYAPMTSSIEKAKVYTPSLDDTLSLDWGYKE